MKSTRFQAALMVLAASLVATAVAPAQEHRAAVTTEPRLDLPVRISVAALTPTIDIAPPSATGEVACTAEFAVEANTPAVRMFAETTALYFNGDLGNRVVLPIPLLESAGVVIDAPGATTSSPNGTQADYVGEGDLIDAFPTRKTAEIAFRSDDQYVFSHHVFLKVKWLQEDPNKPAGRYKGKIKLTCIAEAPQ